MRDSELMANSESATSTTNGLGFKLVDPGNANYETTGLGTKTVTQTGINPPPGPYGSGAVIGSNGDNLTLTWSNTGNQAVRVGYGEAVPEPSSTALLGLSALGLLVRRKR